MSHHPLILAGGGLANTLIALRLLERQPALDFVLLEQGPRLGGNHTWSFHGSDLQPDQWDWVRPLVTYNWDSYEVRFPRFTRSLPGSYHSITSEQLADVAHARLGDRVQTDAEIIELQHDRVRLADGRELTAGAVIDGRGPGPSPELDVRFQKFVGQVVQLEEPHQLKQPIIMDATTEQNDGYRFFYTLPFSPDTLLIEDTHYSDAPDIATDAYGNEIHRYADDQGWKIKAVLREEEGVLPITLGGNLDAFWDNGVADVGRSGLRAALFHPATGYSLPDAVRLAEQLASLEDWSASKVYKRCRQISAAAWQANVFYRILNRMLFLAADAAKRRIILERFYGLNDGLIERFYAGRNTFADKARILLGKPPVSLTRAYSAVFGYQFEGNDKAK